VQKLSLLEAVLAQKIGKVCTALEGCAGPCDIKAFSEICRLFTPVPHPPPLTVPFTVHPMLSKRSIAAILAIAPIVFAQTTQNEGQIVANLKSAATQVDRIELLHDSDVSSTRWHTSTIYTDDFSQYVFNFLAGVGVTDGAYGMTTGANSGNFPALIGNGIAMSMSSVFHKKVKILSYSC
jgi:hypothetical protein